jgi:biopolymer transport protein ExbB
MFEKMREAKFRLNRLLPFIAVTAACAPLLGLLGTVTGIISTFKLMTVFGSGDVKMLSSGISEALITTEFGLYIAIPSVLIHSFLSRKAKGLGEKMEQIAIRFMGEIGKVDEVVAGNKQTDAQAPQPEAAV